MAVFTRLLCLIAQFVILCCTVRGRKSLLPNLREFEESGIYGRFRVPMGPLYDDFQQRKGQDLFCGNDVELSLPEANTNIDETPTDDEAEVNLVLFELSDTTLDRELSCEMKDRVAISKKGVALQTPYVSGSEMGVVLNVIFIADDRDIFHPFPTSQEIIKRVDCIEESDGGIVTVHKGDDVMVLEIQKGGEECRQTEEQELEESMDELVGETFHVTNYPLDFDFWGCSSLDWNVSFCQVLKERQCEIQRFGGDVCTQANITKAHYCPASMTLVNATEYFLDEMRFFSSLPLSSFAGDSYRKHHSNGIIFPCLTS